MTKKPVPTSPSSTETQLSRRDALVGLGGLTLIPAALSALACGDAGQGGGLSGSGGAGSGGAGAGETGAGGAGAGGKAGSGGSATSGGASSGGALASGGTGSGGKASGGESASGGKANAGGSESSGGAAAGGSGGSPGDGIAPPGPWDNVATCIPSYSDGAGQGPFMIHELEDSGDISMYRRDIRGRYNTSAEAGVEMQLHLRILDGSAEGCEAKPLDGAEVYVWNTDAQGFYSGFGTRGTSREQNPDSKYAGVPNSSDLDTKDRDRFCRGVQKTGADGIVSFRSIFPGWYNGRDVHIHALILHAGSTSKGRSDYAGSEHYLTTQFYFEPSLVEAVHKSTQPYLRRTEGALADVWAEAIKGDEAGNSGIRATARLEGGIVIAQLNVLVDPSQSLTVQNNRHP
jgi:protocatechuate 3,4-dioxygenase beta subunit